MTDGAAAWDARVAEVRAALAPVRVVDHGTFLQLVDEDGAHIALVGLDPLQIEVDLSAVLLDATEETLEERIWSAHAFLEDVDARIWRPRGFVLGPEGELSQADVVADPERVILSWDRPTTRLAADMDDLAKTVAWILRQEVDFVA